MIRLPEGTLSAEAVRVIQALRAVYAARVGEPVRGTVAYHEAVERLERRIHGVIGDGKEALTEALIRPDKVWNMVYASSRPGFMRRHQTYTLRWMPIAGVELLGGPFDGQVGEAAVNVQPGTPVKPHGGEPASYEIAGFRVLEWTWIAVPMGTEVAGAD